jgi:hypothetical protein
MANHKRPKPSFAEMDERVDFVCELLARNLHYHQLKREFRNRFGDCSHSTIANYVARARARLYQQVEHDRKDHVAEALATYRDIFQDPVCTPREKIMARERMDKILGVEAPTRVESSGPGGGPINVESAIKASNLTVTDLERMAYIMRSNGEHKIDTNAKPADEIGPDGGSAGDDSGGEEVS